MKEIKACCVNTTSYKRSLVGELANARIPTLILLPVPCPPHLGRQSAGYVSPISQSAAQSSEQYGFTSLSSLAWYVI
jgi:hypothetical protein